MHIQALVLKGLYSQSYGIIQYSCMEVRVGPHIQISASHAHIPRSCERRLSTEELMLLNCGVGEDS